MPKDECFTPCDTELLSDSDVKGSNVEKGVPVNIDVKGKLRSRVILSAPV